MRGCSVPVAAVFLLAGVVGGCGGSRPTEKPQSTTVVARVDWVTTGLGTLGGSSSVATDINERGQVVGISRTASGEQHVFLWQRGKMTDLGPTDGSWPKINERGQVVWNGTLWSAGARHELGVHIRAINNRGQIVAWGEGGSRGVLWEKGRARDLGRFLPDAINDSGAVVGTIDRSGGHAHAVLWRAGAMQALGGLPRYKTMAIAINRRGQVLASCLKLANGRSTACLWDKGEMRRVVVPGSEIAQPDSPATPGDSRYSSSMLLNDRGDITVTSFVCGGDLRRCRRVFLWADGKTTNLRGFWSIARAIDNRGRIVGSAVQRAPGSRHAFLWENGVATDLGRMGAPQLLSEAFALNSKGQIVGVIDSRAVLWTLKPS